MKVDIRKAKQILPLRLEKVERGQEVTITRAGSPIARVVAIASQKRLQKYVLWEWHEADPG
jgi:prevent-host-death family protein